MLVGGAPGASCAAEAVPTELARTLGAEGTMTSVLLILDTKALNVGLSDGLPGNGEELLSVVEVDDKTGPNRVLVRVDS